MELWTIVAVYAVVSGLFVLKLCKVERDLHRLKRDIDALHRKL